ncbi:MAG: glycosyltransferase family 39 protein [Candidatus Zixiibacteriota bacterium]|nr:MAG: glycosyltransferase family 39 protein [candidate division Zixibacteria bacterium]
MTERKKIYYHLAGLFVVALALRIIYLLLAIDQSGMDKLWNWAPDTNLYWALGEHMFTDPSVVSFGLFRVGPGYGAILASIRFLFGPDPIWAILFSVLMGSLAPVIIYLLAYNLFRSYRVALIAGTIAAFSQTSISMSCSILTDQPYFTLQAAALLTFVVGYNRSRLKWLVAAGLISGLATLVRPSGQFWPFIFLFLAALAPVWGIYKSRFHMFKRVGITGAVMLLITVGWSFRNYVVHDVFTFGSNGIMTVNACLIAQVISQNPGQGSIGDLRRTWEAEDWNAENDYATSYARAQARALRVLSDYTRRSIKAYWHNVWENMTDINYYSQRQLAPPNNFIENLNAGIRRWVNPTLAFLTVIGLLLLLVQRRYFAALLLGTTYAYFSLVLGFSFWQGSRLHYPAEMAWSIILAYAASELATWTHRWFLQIKSRSATG